MWDSVCIGNGVGDRGIPSPEWESGEASPELAEAQRGFWGRSPRKEGGGYGAETHRLWRTTSIAHATA